MEKMSFSSEAVTSERKNLRNNRHSSRVRHKKRNFNDR